MNGNSNGNTLRISTEIRAMRKSVTMLDRSIRRLAPILKAVASNGHSTNGFGRKRLNLTPKQRAALKLQGRYMGFIRQLTPKEKAEVRRIRERRGVLAAVQKAEQLARG